MDHMSLRRWSAAVGVLFGVLVALLPATPAGAHAVLERSDPNSGQLLQSEPGSVTLTFSEQVRPVAGKIRITGPDGKRADQGKPTVTNHDLKIPLLAGGPEGTYLVSYRVISADSHPISGGFAYSVGKQTDTPTSDTSEPVNTSTTVSVAIASSRCLGFAGLILVVGPAFVLFALWPRRLSTKGPARLAMWGIVVLAAGTIAELYLQIPYSSGTGLFDISSDAVSEVMSTPFAAAHLVRLGILASVTVLLRPVINGKAGRVDQTLLVILGLVGLATWPISGHPSTSPVPTLTVVADIAHLGSMAIWLGGLIMLFGFLLRRADDRELGAILPVWSSWAMFAVTVLVLAGTAQALVEIGTVSALTGTTFGRLVIVKVCLLAGVLAVAWFSRRLVNTHFAVDPATDADEDETEAGDDDAEAGARELDAPRTRLRTGVFAELAIAAVVLGVTAALVQTTPARTAEANANVPAETYSVTQSNNLFKVEVDISPATRGANTIHVYAFSLKDGSPLPVVEWEATAALPAAGVEPVSIPILAITPDHATGQILLPQAGTWEFRFTLRLDDTHQASVTNKVTVK
jgi:copper transport protein